MIRSLRSHLGSQDASCLTPAKLLALLVISCVLAPNVIWSSAQAQTEATWTGGAGTTSYSDPDNWNTPDVPINDGGTTYNVTIPNSVSVNYDVDGVHEVTDLTLGTGSNATLKWDGTNLVSTLTAGEFQITGGKLLLDNNEPLQIKDTGGTYRDILYISGGNNVILGMIGTGWGGSTNIYAGTRMYFYVNRATASKGAGLIDPSGRWCIGSNYTPTAVADIDASTTAAASMRLRSGTAPTSPNAGDIWYDGTNLKFYDGVATRTLSWT